jgi:hypothetical protein
MKEVNLTTFFEVEVGLRTSVLGLACDAAVLSLSSVAFGLPSLYHCSWPVLRIFFAPAFLRRFSFVDGLSRCNA